MLYRFDDYRLDLDRFVLLRAGQPVPVEPQVLELLHLLIANSQRMVSKQEILDTIWRGRFVSEAALSSRIKSARQALGDDGRTQRYIRTVHRRGFQFVGALQEEAEAPARAPAASAGPHDHPRILIMPLQNLSSDSEQEYFSDGMTGDIITHLSKHKWLDVIARNTAFGFKGRAIGSDELQRQYGIDYVVEGSVQRLGSRVRVNVSLVSTHQGTQIWADRYDREVEDIFQLQDEITEKIVARLEPEIGFAERRKVIHARPANLKAWDCYQMGVHHFFRFTGPDNEKAQQLLKESQRLDEYFGEAYAWWAYALVVGMVYWSTPPSQLLLDEALEACNKAMELDSHNATFYALRARVLLARREYDAALRENEIAISLNPTLAAAHCGLGDSLAYEARYEESIQCFERAIELSPNDPQLWAFLTYGALALIFKGDHEKAVHWLDRAHSIPNCQYWTLAHKVVALANLDKLPEARLLLDRLQREMPEFSRQFVEEKLFYLKEREQIDLYLRSLERVGLV